MHNLIPRSKHVHCRIEPTSPYLFSILLNFLFAGQSLAKENQEGRGYFGLVQSIKTVGYDAGAWDSWSHCTYSQEKRNKESGYSASIFLPIQPSTSVHGIVLCKFKVCHPISKPSVSHWNILRFVSIMIIKHIAMTAAQNNASFEK